MNFSEEQSEQIYQFIMKYNSDENFRNDIENTYNNEICKLSILEIYALEEVLRCGTRGIYSRFTESIGGYTEAQAASLFDEFVKLLNDDENFREYKTQQLVNAPETLSAIETLAFSLISKLEEEKEETQEEATEELEYAPFNPILYSTDKQIRETLENLFFGEFIHKLLELPSMKSIRDRQIEPGRIANIDKSFIIEKIQKVISEQGGLSQVKQIIDNRFIKVKMNVLLQKGEDAFDEYLKYNTNINSYEILGIERDNSEEDMVQFFKDVINKVKQDRGPKM